MIGKVYNRIVPMSWRQWILRRTIRASGISPDGLQRLTPLSNVFGLDRGQSVARYYIAKFLSQYSADIRGHVLEVGDDTYTCQFGGSRVHQVDVLHVVPGNPKATIVADLENGDIMPDDSFDCVILTQTLQCIYDVRAALRTINRTLRPGGVILATVPGISRISRYDMDRWGDYWRFTTLSTQRMFAECFPRERVVVQSFGNVSVAVAALYGLAVQDLDVHNLEYHDPEFQILIGVRAVKPESI